MAALGTALTTLALMTACSTSHPQGPAGQVVAKDSDRDCHTSWTGTGRKRHSRQSCHTDYELTTRDKHGSNHEFEVNAGVYDSCRRGSAYPRCINR